MGGTDGGLVGLFSGQEKTSGRQPMPPFPCRKPTAGPVRTSGITDRCSPQWGFPFPLSAWQAVQTACAPFPRCAERRFPTGKVFQRETEKSSSFPERPGTAICCGRNAFSAKTPDSPRKAHETGLHAAQNRDDRRAESLSADRPGFTPEADKNVPRGVPRFSPESPAEEKNGGPAQGETDGLWPYRTRGEPQATDSRPSTPDIPKEILKIHTGIPILP